MLQLLGGQFLVPRLWMLWTSVATRCATYAHNNPVSWPQQPLGVQRQGSLSLEDVEVDFTEIKSTSRNKKCLLVLICLSSGWVKVTPTWIETSREIVIDSMELIIFYYGLLIMVDSDNGPAFVGRVVQDPLEALELKEKLQPIDSRV